RNRIRNPSEGARPHRNDVTTNSSTAVVNNRTCPKRCVSQPVSGSEIALATAKEVMTHVPWSGETPRSPAIAGSDTFAIDVSSTFMNVASDSEIVPSTSAPPFSGSGCGGGSGLAGAGKMTRVGMFRHAALQRRDRATRLVGRDDRLDARVRGCVLRTEHVGRIRCGAL